MEILNNASITIKNLSTIVLTIMPQHSQIRYGTSKKKKKKKNLLKNCNLRTVPSYLNTTKKCLHEKLEILYYPNTDELIKKLSELIVKCRHANKYLPCNYKSRDWKHHKELLVAPMRRSWRLISVIFMWNIEAITNILCRVLLFSSNFLMRKFSVDAITGHFLGVPPENL